MEINLLLMITHASHLVQLVYNKTENSAYLVHLNAKTIILVKFRQAIKFVLNVLKKCYLLQEIVLKIVPLAPDMMKTP